MSNEYTHLFTLLVWFPWKEDVRIRIIKANGAIVLYEETQKYIQREYDKTPI